MDKLRLNWQRFRFATYRQFLPELWYFRLLVRAHSREEQKLQRRIQRTQDPQLNEKLNLERAYQDHFAMEAHDKIDHLRSQHLVRKAASLDLHGWPEDDSKYVDGKGWGKTWEPALNEEGFAFVKKQIRDEQHARLSLWKERIAVFSPLVSALIGAVTALIARSC